MKHTNLFLAAILLLSTFSSRAEEATRHLLSREKCLEIALSTSPTIKVADMEITKTDYSKREVLAKLFPSVDFSAAYQRAIELQTVSMNMGGKPQQFKMGSENVISTGFTAQMPLVNATLWKSIKLSDQQILATLESARASRLNMVNNVNKAYYAAMLAIASRDVINANYKVAVENAEIYKKQFDQGTASEYDVLRSSVQVKNIEPELLQADISVKQCLLQLKVLMGVDMNMDIYPSTSLKEMQGMMFNYTSTLDGSFNNNTSLKTLDIQTETLRQNVLLKKFAWIPTLGLQYNMNWNSMSSGSPFKSQQFFPYSTVSLALSIPIFSGGSKYYGVKQAEVQHKEALLQRETLESSLRMQVDIAIDNINKQVKQISSSEEGVKQAAKAYEIMQKSFEIGAASYLNLRDAELANTQAQLAHLQSIYNYLVSTSELDNLLGKDYIPSTTAETTN